jgi:hypothetical protein
MNKISNASRMRSLLFAACACLTLVVPVTATTITFVPAPVIQVNGEPGDFGTFSTPGSTITLASLPNPSITATTSGSGSTEGIIDYYVVITGGQFGDAVPLLVTGSLSTSASGGTANDVVDTSAGIGINFFNGNYGASESVSCGNVLRGEDCSNFSWSGTLSALAVVGYDNVIAISASTTVSGSGTGYAFADPYVYIDPAFLATHPDYGLALNVGNTASTTPEPSTLLLASGCLLGLFVAARRKVLRAPSNP